jgi:hypothetical protein
MNIRLCAAASAASALLATAPLAAGAQPTAGSPVAQTSIPISVRSCTVLAYSASSPNQLFYIQTGPPSQSNRTYSDGLKISYVNVSSKVIARVGFRVTYGGKSERVIDAGTISPGVTIDRTFGDDFSGGPYFGPQPSECRVLGVRYKDGTVWRNTATPAP